MSQGKRTTELGCGLLILLFEFEVRKLWSLRVWGLYKQGPDGDKDFSVKLHDCAVMEEKVARGFSGRLGRRALGSLP